MNSIEVMVKEHDNIKRMLLVVQKMCIGVMEGKEVDQKEFAKVIDFIRTYADKHHHGKEEQFLFPEMIRQFGPIGDNLITHGMLVEHDLGRAHVWDLEIALEAFGREPSPEHRLDIITSAMAYAHLLVKHIDKENEVVYTFAEKKLTPEGMQAVNESSRMYEEQEASEMVRTKYLTFLKEMEMKYELAG